MRIKIVNLAKATVLHICLVFGLWLPQGIYLYNRYAHEGFVLSGFLTLRVPTFMNVKHWVVRCTMRVLASECVALLCRLISKLCMWRFLQHDSRWRHVFFFS